MCTLGPSVAMVGNHYFLKYNSCSIILIQFRSLCVKDNLGIFNLPFSPFLNLVSCRKLRSKIQILEIILDCYSAPLLSLPFGPILVGILNRYILKSKDEVKEVSVRLG